MLSKSVIGRAVLLILTLMAMQSAKASLINGGFETPANSPGVPNFNWLNQALVPSWSTAAIDGNIEIWSDGFGGFASYEGNQHAEINATMVGLLFQDAPGIAAGSVVGFQFAHRGRYALPDTMQFTLTDLGGDNLPGGGDDTVLFTQVYSDNNTAWGFYTGTGIITLGNTVRFSFASLTSGAGLIDGGNFIDAADFGIGVSAPPSPVPTLSQWGMIFLVMLLALVGSVMLRRELLTGLR